MCANFQFAVKSHTGNWYMMVCELEVNNLMDSVAAAFCRVET